MDDGFKGPDQEIFEDQTTSSDDTSNISSPPSLPDERMMFEGSKPLVLDLHDMTRDKQRKSLATELKKKVRKKKKNKAAKLKKESSSSSASDSSLQPKSDAKEEFYDAHESYHGIPAHQKVNQKVTMQPRGSVPSSQLTTPATPAILTINDRAEETAEVKTSASLPGVLSDPLAAAKTAIKKPTE